jgi:hypothetical protein
MAGALRFPAGQHLPLHSSRPHESDTGETLDQPAVPLLAFHQGLGSSVAFGHIENLLT